MDETITITLTKDQAMHIAGLVRYQLEGIDQRDPERLSDRAREAARFDRDYLDKVIHTKSDKDI